MNYVGLDIHARNFNISVLSKDNMIIFETELPTSADNLRSVIGAIAEPKCVVLEESTVAAWAYRTILPYADQVIVADPVTNAWISKDENINDAEAARKLAQLLRAGYINPVHHNTQHNQLFKELVQLYHDTSAEVARFKNKLKAKFRQHGVNCTGTQVYSDKGRQRWLEQLEDAGARYQVEFLFNTIDHLQAQKDRLRRDIAKRAKAFEAIGRFQQIPGVGLIRAATFFAIIDTPHRFANKRKLWSYCGLGIAKQTSDQMSGPQHLTRRGNPMLKAMAKGAAVTAIGPRDNRFAVQCRALLIKGVRPESARLTVARAIISTLWAMWRKDEEYIPGKRSVAGFDAQTKQGG